MKLIDIINPKKYIEFNLVAIKPKTAVWAVRNIDTQMILGFIKWYCNWRQYCFEPLGDTIFSVGCLKDIENFIKKATKAHKKYHKNVHK